MTMLIQLVVIASLSSLVAATVGYPSSFANPGNQERPKFRYWIPDASVSTDVIADDIRAAGSIGAGGIEVLGFYAYGGNLGGPPPSVDWAQDGWGTQNWKTVQDAAIQAAASADIVVDLTLGPNQGAGVPTNFTDPGRLWQLVPFNVTVEAGTTFNEVLPGWGTGDLVAATMGMVVQNSSINLTSSVGFVVSIVPGRELTLSVDSLTDLTSQVGQDGRIKVGIPSDPSNNNYILFGFYENHPLTYEQLPFNNSPITSYVQNGSWAVDHFSSQGADTIINFWEQNLLDESNRALLKQAGSYFWEDSQEWQGQLGGVTIMWTPALPSYFDRVRRYSLAKYLPLITYGNNGFNGELVSTDVYVTDESDRGQSHISDYRQSLTELNQNYLSALSSWSKTVGMEFSAQPGYNLQLDMLATIPYVDIPETESLGFNDNVDSYRQFTGPAKLAGKKIVSSELGALMGSVYGQSIPDILWHIKRSLAFSINQFIIHGQAWSGAYPGCTYPSYTTFSYLFSEMHGPHLPAWEFYGDWFNYTARSQHILQNSVPKYDVAFWLKNVSYTTVPTSYEPTDLQDAGYTYQYLSPDNLALPAAYVRDNILAPDAQAFKALVVRANQVLTASGVSRLARLAEAGLPIFFSGGLPYTQLGYSEADQEYINNTINDIAKLSNVYTVPYEDLAVSLLHYGITPRTTVNMPSGVFTHWSTDDSSDYVLVYNDAAGITPGEGAVTGSIIVETTGNPYLYDAWTGMITPVETFARAANNKTVIPIELAGNQTVIIGFKNDEPQKPAVIVASTSVASLVAADGHECYEAKVISSSAGATLSLASGTTVQLPAFNVPPTTLMGWSLTIESWTPPTADLNNSAALSVRTNTTYKLDTLVPWNQITTANLTDTAGRGYYHTTFSWPPSASSSSSSDQPITGAILDLQTIAHTARVSINGQPIPPLDVSAPKSDIGSYLISGQNTIEIVVSTPLRNALREYRSQLHCLSPEISAVGTMSLITPTENGLLKDVLLYPYTTVRVNL